MEATPYSGLCSFLVKEEAVHSPFLFFEGEGKEEVVLGSGFPVHLWGAFRRAVLHDGAAENRQSSPSVGEPPR